MWALAVALLFALGRRTQARELATLIPNLLVLFKGLLQDTHVSRRNKACLWFAVVWLVSPIDLIPEFIPFLGPLDDAVVAALVLRHVLRTTDARCSPSIGEVIPPPWRGSRARDVNGSNARRTHPVERGDPRFSRPP